MTLVLDDINMANDYVISNIIFNNGNRNDEVRGCTLVFSAVSFRSISSFSFNKSEELYWDRMQRKSDKMVQNEPTTISDSFQLEYTTPERQNLNISKTADTSPNMRIEYMHNTVPTYVNFTMDNNNDVINIQLNYNINQPLD